MTTDVYYSLNIAKSVRLTNVEEFAEQQQTQLRSGPRTSTTDRRRSCVQRNAPRSPGLENRRVGDFVLQTTGTGECSQKARAGENLSEFNRETPGECCELLHQHAHRRRIRRNERLFISMKCRGGGFTKRENVTAVICFCGV